jgi:dihydropteridine reductase
MTLLLRKMMQMRRLGDMTASSSLLFDCANRRLMQSAACIPAAISTATRQRRFSSSSSSSFNFSSRSADYDHDGGGGGNTGAGNSIGPRTALILGSSGALGSTVARYLSQTVGMQVLGADVAELPSDFSSDGWDLDGFIHLPKERSTDLTDLTVRLVKGVEFFLQSDDTSLDAIVVASGGWSGDPSWDAIHYDRDEHKDPEAELEERARAYADTIERMRLQNLDPVCAAGFVAQQFMSPNGLMVVLGATAALSPTPGMLGYGLAKAASHHLVQTLGAVTGKSIESKAVRQAAKKLRNRNPVLDSLSVLAILPTTIDTPSNRKAMPNGKFDQWTKPKDIAVRVYCYVLSLLPDLPFSLSLSPTDGM